MLDPMPMNPIEMNVLDNAIYMALLTSPPAGISTAVYCQLFWAKGTLQDISTTMKLSNSMLLLSLAAGLVQAGPVTKREVTDGKASHPTKIVRNSY